MHVMWGGKLLPLLNGIRVINQLFTKWERTSLSCFVSNSLSSHSLSLPDSLPFLSLLPSLSLSLIPNQRDGLEVPWGWIRMSAAAQSGLLSHTALRSMYKFTHAHAEKTAHVNIVAYAWTYFIHMHAQHLLTHVFSKHMSYYEYISHMHRKPHTDCPDHMPVTSSSRHMLGHTHYF